VDVDPSAVLSIYIPPRPIRRKVSGAICAVCHMRVHHLDAALIELPFGKTKAIHQPCSALLWEQVQEMNDALDDLSEDDLADLAADPDEQETE
jgi:hypothetical protein